MDEQTRKMLTVAAVYQLLRRTIDEVLRLEGESDSVAVTETRRGLRKLEQQLLQTITASYGSDTR